MAAEKELVLSSEQIQARVREIARTISDDYRESELVLIGILNGVFMFFADLVKNLSIPVMVDFVRVASYGSASQSDGNVRLVKDVEIAIDGRDVLVIEDIVDSGHTLAFLQKHLQARSCRSLRFCALIDKSERREREVALDYRGFHVKEGFLVGYGLDYDERYRYLPAIYHLKL